mgnify:FL=1
MENLRSKPFWDRSPLESLADGYKKLPRNFKLCMLATFIIGLAAHMYCYTNMLTGADDAFLFSDTRTFADGASGTRWLLAIYFALIKTIRMPWLLGVMTLLLYGIAAWLVCETLSITSSVGIILVSGLMVTSPTMISSNFYLTSAHMYAGALLFACLAAYAYKKWRHSWIAAFVFMLLSEGSYAAYISMTLCLFFLCSLKELLFDQEANDKHNLVRHFGMLFLFGGSMVATTVICNLITANNTAGRVQDAQAQAATDYIDNIITSVQQVFAFFLPGTSNSYFHGERVMYSLFLLCAALSAVLVTWLLVKQQLWKRPLGLFLLVADIVCLPLAMNVIGIVSKWVHTLMTFAYLTPWLFFVMAVEQLYRREDLRKDWEKLLRWGYSLLACVVAGLTVLFGIRLANICYTKAYARYTEGIADSIRLTNLIEAIPNYVKGETPVAFVGVSDNHFPRQDAYELTSDIAGIGDLYYWQGMYTAPFVLDSYVNQHLRANMLIFPQDAAIFTADTIADQLNDAGINASADEIKELLQDLHAFPKEDCWTWYNDVLLIKLFAN